MVLCQAIIYKVLLKVSYLFRKGDKGLHRLEGALDLQNREDWMPRPPQGESAPGASGLPGTAPSMGPLVGLAVLFELKYHKSYYIVRVRRRN